MRIESTQIQMQTSHSMTSKHSIVERRIQRLRPPMVSDSVTLSVHSRAAVSEAGGDSLQGVDAKHRAAILVLERIFGCRFQWIRSCSTGTRKAASSPASPAPISAEIIHRSEIHLESEQTSFQASGSVQLADGRTIAFRAELQMSRSYYAESSSLSAVQATDPLVVNLSGGPARLTRAEVAFDLNADGTEDRIHFVAEGSAFLVLDRNEDGTINDGSELFGPGTGNGFGELALYDADGNDWIDQGDPIYDRLGLWSQSGIQKLSEAGIGAISLVAIETPFSITGTENELWGQVRTTAVYLMEDGSPGTIQQVDLA